MGKTLFAVALLLLFTCSYGQSDKNRSVTAGPHSPKISFSQAEANFDIGSLPVNTSVTYEIQFHNSGDLPLIVSGIHIGPRCASDPKIYIQFTWTKKPVNPKKDGVITITYISDDNVGSFKNDFFIESNAGADNIIQFSVSGAVIPFREHFEKDYEDVTPLGALIGAFMINNMRK